MSQPSGDDAVTESTVSEEVAETRELYVELLKRALTHTLYWPPDVQETGAYKQAIKETVQLGEPVDFASARLEGRDTPRYAQTMVGMHRLDNVQHCVERVLADGVPGDLIETGVWRGGVAIFMRGLLKAHGVDDRRVYVADSFRGLPEPNPDRYPADGGPRPHTSDVLPVQRRAVKRNFELYGLLDDRVRFLAGWFSETLPRVRKRKWAIVRLDGDLYESTMDALVNLYPGLSTGGYLIIDDYHYEPCREAVHDFRAEHEIADPIEEIDWTGVFWRRGEAGPRTNLTTNEPA